MIRHSTAHLLAYAVKELYPEAQVTIGPVIDNGFLLRLLPTSAPSRPKTSSPSRRSMTELARKDETVTREVWNRDEAVALFESMGEKYKAEIIASIPADEEIGLYREGNFVDLCRGPHVPSTGKLKVFKLMKVAGAYWRGDSNNEMLQRVYGTAWAKKEDQDAYLHDAGRGREARSPQARQAARPVPPAGGSAGHGVLASRRAGRSGRRVEQYMRGRLGAGNGYQEVRTPQVMDRSLWEKSGHWQNYKENMFVTESEKRDYAIKPMNCPGHVQIFNHGLRSLPRPAAALAEFGACHRNEPSGALHGLDARARLHAGRCAHLLHGSADRGRGEGVQRSSRSRSMTISASRTWRSSCRCARPSAPARTRSGITPRKACAWPCAPAAWSGKSCRARAPSTARRSSTTSRTPSAARGSAARCSWIWCCRSAWARNTSPRTTRASVRSCSTGAILGSVERFLGILLENHAGALPAWLAPEQVVVLNIADSQSEYAESVVQLLQKQGFRAKRRFA